MTKVTWMTPFWDSWKETFGPESMPPEGPMARYLWPLIEKYGSEAVEARWRPYLARKGEYASPARFAQFYGAMRPEEKPSTPVIDYPIVEDGWLTPAGDILTKPRS